MKFCPMWEAFEPAKALPQSRLCRLIHVTALADVQVSVSAIMPS